MYFLCFLTIFKCWYLWAQDEARAKESGRVLAPAAVEVAVFGARCRAPRAMKNEGPVSGSFVFKTSCWGAVHNFRSARNTRQKVQTDSRMGTAKKRPLWYSRIRLKSVRGNISILNNISTIQVQIDFMGLALNWPGKASSRCLTHRIFPSRGSTSRRLRGSSCLKKCCNTVPRWQSWCQNSALKGLTRGLNLLDWRFLE